MFFRWFKLVVFKFDRDSYKLLNIPLLFPVPLASGIQAFVCFPVSTWTAHTTVSCIAVGAMAIDGFPTRFRNALTK